MLTCIRKLASLCFALDLAVTVRLIPSETNVSDKSSRIHDPSDIRDKTMTDLLATMVQMMAQRDPQETAPRFKMEMGHCVRRLWRRIRRECREWEREGGSDATSTI